MKSRALALALSLSVLLPSYSIAAEVTSKSQQTAPGIFIDSSIYLPKKTPAPAILLAHGFGGSKDSVVTEAQAFQKRGYVVMTWTARGFGKSTGQISMNSLSAEIADVQELITTLGKRKDVLQDR